VYGVRHLSMRALALAAAAGLVLASPPALAADPYFSAPAPITYGTPTVYDWSGAYVGLTLGRVWGSFDTTAGAPFNSSFSFDAGAVAIGALGGMTAQTGNFVFGVELDANFADVERTRIITGVPITAETDWFAAIRARAGYAFDRFLIYGTGGLATGRLELSVPWGSQSSRELGWTIGAGIEAALTDNFTARAEYLYTDFGTATGTLGGSPFSTEFDSHTLRAGIVYRFR
jgi:outer membrane immunogenic protein